ncbi:unnamed protein product, partial [Didymodactylos carnosus]
ASESSSATTLQHSEAIRSNGKKRAEKMNHQKDVVEYEQTTKMRIDHFLAKYFGIEEAPHQKSYFSTVRKNPRRSIMLLKKLFGHDETYDKSTDEARLHALGYKQELKRSLSTVTNYGVSLSIISISSGITSLFGYGMITGGPVVMVWGWLIVSIFTLIVGAAMAEICSANPTSGGLYFWTAILVPESYKPFASWITGWFNLIGQFAVTAAIDFGLSLLIGSVISVGSNNKILPKPRLIILIHLIVILSHGVSNSLGPRSLRYITYISTWWQVFAPLIVTLALFIGPKYRQPGTFIFTHFVNQTGWSNTYAILIGLLQAQYTISGFDASAHMTEETKRADTAGSHGMLLAIAVSGVTGWLFLIALCMGIKDYGATVNTITEFPVTQILLDNFGTPLGLFFIVILLVACWFCGLSSVTANSRMIYAFSRDHAMPGSRYWHRINRRVMCPLNAVWLSCFIAFIIALPYLRNTTAYSAVTSLSTICLYISYVMPIFWKLLFPKYFHPGPFNLGKWSTLIDIIAVIWVAFIVVLFVLPPLYPVTSTNMNYACVGVGAVILGSGLGYLLDARKWFQGPMTNIADDATIKTGYSLPISADQILPVSDFGAEVITKF